MVDHYGGDVRRCYFLYRDGACEFAILISDQ